MSTDIPSRDPEVLPGAACDFAVIFSVPEAAVLKDLVHQSAFYGGPSNRDKIMRVSVGPQ